ncbi:MAG: PmoA family protein [Opitutaceae bacterium]
MKTRIAPLVVLLALALPAVLSRAASDATVKLSKTQDRVRVEIGGQLFTEYIFKGGPVPYLYPVLAPDGTALTRDFPMKKVDGEEQDHTHHRSLWFTHGAVNGVDFWQDVPKRGFVVNEAVSFAIEKGVGIVRARNKWEGPDKALHCTDETTIQFRATPNGRLIDYEVTIKAPADKPVVLGDTKEGSMAVRVAQWLTPTHRFAGKDSVGSTGTLVNDAGAKNDAVWSKKSTWIDNFGTKDGKVYGIAIFDHSKNLRYPTWWHARTYGLLAANPFGQHDFEPAHKANPNAGDVTIPAGGSLTFRWRVYVHTGDTAAAKVAEQYAAYAAGK